MDHLPTIAVNQLFSHHERSFESNRFVYPVVSRRSGGVSLGVNLNPDKICNFDCIYCQVNRVEAAETTFVELPQLLAELDASLTLVTSGRLFEHPKFAGTPPQLRRLNDMAFSGDGEPTTFRNFDTLIGACAEVKRRHHLDGVKMVLITNASMFHRPVVRRGLELLDRNQGEIWAKLDAGTPEYFRTIDRTSIPFRQVLDNITAAAQVRPIVIQSLFMRVHEQPPSAAEIAEFSQRLNETIAAGGSIKLVQIYTIARQPTESYVAPLTHIELDEIVDTVRRDTRLPVAPYYGVGGA